MSKGLRRHASKLLLLVVHHLLLARLHSGLLLWVAAGVEIRSTAGIVEAVTRVHGGETRAGFVPKFPFPFCDSQVAIVSLFPPRTSMRWWLTGVQGGLSVM